MTSLAEAVAEGRAVYEEEGSPWQGKKNLYSCEICGSTMITIDRDSGVTPFLKMCLDRMCPGMMRSRFYPRNIQAQRAFVPTHEWYRPEPDEEDVDEGLFDHVSQGGLILREIGAQDG